uniref:Uncharacterized protein n=1 Tax=Manihot esculenta TaxID=3983 RepID=A0A2C9V900_MANES
MESLSSPIFILPYLSTDFHSFVIYFEIVGVTLLIIGIGSSTMC